MAKHFRTLFDLGTHGLLEVLSRARELKQLRGRPEHPKPLACKSIAVLLEKASTRTRVSFEVGIQELGGHAVVLEAQALQLNRGETIEDTARVLSGYVHGIVYRTHGHERVEALAHNASVPIINGLSDSYHPCQLLADLMTAQESFMMPIDQLKVAWVGDGNNMAHSWINAAALLGFELALATPANYVPDAEVVSKARQQYDANITLATDLRQAVLGAHVVATDVWTSMGQEEENHLRRVAFAGHTVTERLMQDAAKEAIFLHCLPVHRGEEVEAAVIDGPASRVWQEAENRLHAQKALLERLIGDEP